MRFEIFGYRWQVELTDDKKKLLVNNEFCKGAIHYKESTIYIYSDTSPKDRSRLLLHELSHAVLYETQITLKQNYSEEDLCEFMAKYGKLIVELHDKIITDLIK